MTTEDIEPTTLLEVAPFFAWTADAQGRRTYANPELRRFVGHSREKALGAWESAVHPRDLPRCRTVYSEVLKGGGEDTLQYRLRREDGTFRWVSERCRALLDHAGTVTGIAGFAVDITEERRAFLDAEQGEQRFRTLVEAMPQFAWWADAGGRVLYVNQQWTEFSGLNAEQTTDCTPVLTHPDEVEAASQAWRQARSTGEGYEIEARLRRRDGEYRWVHCRNVPVLREGSVVAWFGIASDIHEQRLARAALEESERRFRLAVEAAGFGPWEWDLVSGRIVFSEALERLFGLEPGTFDGTYEMYERMAHPDDHPRVRAAMDAIIARQDGASEQFMLQQRIIRADGADRWLEARGEVVVGTDGSVVGLRGVTVDVTERVEAERARAARERQQAAVARLGRLALAPRPEGDAELLDVTVREVADTLDVGFVKLLELLPGGDELLVRAGAGWRPGVVGSARLSADAQSHAGYTLVSDQAVIVDDLATDRRLSAPPLLLEHGIVSGLSVIIPGRDRPFGVLAAHDAHHRSFTQDDINFLEAVANVIASAMQRRQAEEDESFLSEASAVLSASLDIEETLGKVMDLGVPRLADWCAVHLVGDDPSEPTELAARHRDPTKLDRLRKLREPFLLGPQADVGVHHVLRTGQSELYPDISNAMLNEAATSEEHLESMRLLGIRSAILVPMRAAGRVLGVMIFVNGESGRRYFRSHLALAERLAERAGMAVDNARSYRTAQELARLREEFVSIASHELRTPLTTVLGFSRRLALRARDTDSGFDEMSRDEIELVRSEAERMRSTLEVFLDLARLETDQFPVEPAVVDLKRLSRREVEAVRVRYPHGRVTLHAADGAVEVETDEDRLHQVLTNLLDNAMKYGGTPPEVDVALERLEHSVLLTVSDNGPGVPPEARPHIFDRYYRGPQLHPSGRRGLGLGLYISREIARRLGAHLTFAERPGGGSAFSLQLPVTLSDRGLTAGNMWSDEHHRHRRLG